MFYFIIQYKHPKILHIVFDNSVGQARTFNTRSEARKFAIKNCLGVYEIYRFGGGNYV